MNQLATIDLPPATPERVRAILAAAAQLKVGTSKVARLRTPHGTYPLLLLDGVAPYARSTALALTELTGPDRVGLVVAERLLTDVRRELENAGLSYADATGALHLEAPGVFVHVEVPAARTPGALPPPRGLGVVAVRVVQALLTDPDRAWTVTELATEAASSIGQAHNVLQRLDDEALIDTTGAGPARRRRVRNPADLLDWLSRVPAARKFHGRLNTYLYAPDPDELVTRLARNAQKTATPWALTGAAAAHTMGVKTVTALPVLMVRVADKPGLPEAAKGLGLEPVDTSPNVMLVADVGQVGLHGRQQNGPVALAPAVRIWLDMLSEPRGEDATALFREAVLGY